MSPNFDRPTYNTPWFPHTSKEDFYWYFHSSVLYKRCKTFHCPQKTLNKLTAHAFHVWWMLTCCFTAAVIVSHSGKELQLNAQTTNSCWSKKLALMCRRRAMMKSGGTRVRTDYTAGCSPLISLTLEHPECIMGIKKKHRLRESLARETWIGHTSHWQGS